MKGILLAPALALLLCTGAAAAEPMDQSRIVATTEGPQVYVVHPGDTLWDISNRFFDTPWVWPKLWEQNSFLVNPHQLSPGQTLNLYEGMFALPAAAPAETPAPVAEEAEAIPAPPAVAEPVVDVSPLVQDVGYLSRDKAKPVGFIFEAQDPDKITLGRGDLAYVRLDDRKPEVGERFRVVHISEDEVPNPATGEPMGYEHTFPAELELVEVTGHAATAVVTECYRDIEVGDGFVDWFPMPDKVSVKRGTWKFEGHVVEAQAPLSQIGQYHLVFLDVGKAEGVEPGMLVGLWREPKTEGEPSVSGLEATRLGQAIVLLVRPDSSTALITNSLRELAAGDIARSEP